MTARQVTQVRVARHTTRLPEVVAFYRDRLGFREIGSFTDHDGYSGTFLQLPGAEAHLEITTGGLPRSPVQPDPDDLLVLYLGSAAAVDELVQRVPDAVVAPENPYWAGRATTLEDPDGRRLVLVPGTWPAGS